MISVVLTTYNGEKYIIKQLDSLKNQTLTPDEVLIFDDRSSDNTVAVVKGYIEKNGLNWKLSVNEENLGYKKNFLNGLEAASGDIIFLSDQDDEWKPDKIEMMNQFMEEHPDVLALNTAVEIIDGDSMVQVVKPEKNRYNSNIAYFDHPVKKIEYLDTAYIMKHNVTPGCAICIRKALRDEFVSFYDFRMPHDWVLNCIAAVHDGCVYWNEITIDYRVHSNNQIGVNTSVSKAINTRTREYRIEDYSNRVITFKRLIKKYDLTHEEKKIVNCLVHMVSFYKSPSLKKYNALQRNAVYKEMVKPKIRLWEFLVSLNMDKVIIKTANRG